MNKSYVLKCNLTKSGFIGSSTQFKEFWLTCFFDCGQNFFERLRIFLRLSVFFFFFRRRFSRWRRRRRSRRTFLDLVVTLALAIDVSSKRHFYDCYQKIYIKWNVYGFDSLYYFKLNLSMKYAKSKYWLSYLFNQTVAFLQQWQFINAQLFNLSSFTWNHIRRSTGWSKGLEDRWRCERPFPGRELRDTRNTFCSWSCAGKSPRLYIGILKSIIKIK